MNTAYSFGPPTLDQYLAERNAPDPNAELTFFVQYEPYTGEVISTGQCSVPAFEHMAAGDGFYLRTEEMLEWSSVYVDLTTNEVKAKEPNPATRSGMTLSNLPLDGVLVIYSKADPFFRHFDIDTPEIALEFEHPGTYRVKVKSVRYLEVEFEVQA